MRDQDAFSTSGFDLDIGLDQIIAAAYIRRDIGRHMAMPAWNTKRFRAP